MSCDSPIPVPPSATGLQPAPAAAQKGTGASAKEPLSEPPAIPTFEKPVYSADQLKAFKERQDTAQLLFIAESYIGKPLTPSEMKTILYFTDVLHFSEDLTDYLLQYCVGRGSPAVFLPL